MVIKIVFSIYDFKYKRADFVTLELKIEEVDLIFKISCVPSEIVTNLRAISDIPYYNDVILGTGCLNFNYLIIMIVVI